MSEPTPPPPEAPAAARPGVPPGEAPAPKPENSPFDSSFLPPNMRKHVDPKAPAALRMMAAKSLVPLQPGDLLGVLYMLTFDAEASIRETAERTAQTLPDRILTPALRDEGVQPQTLAYFAERVGEKEAYAEALVLNPSTPDEAIARLATLPTVKVLELISQNQLRILRHENIIRSLAANAAAPQTLVDSVTDFAVRSGLTIDDVPQMQEARVRIFGAQAAPPAPGPTADELMKEFKEIVDEKAPPLEEGKRMNLTQRIQKMNVAQKIKLATVGNKEARSLLIRDTNKLVCTAVIRSPRITDGEVLAISNNKTMSDDVLRIIYSNREWTKNYSLRMALIKNPKIPMGITLRFLNTLHDNDIKSLARDKNVPGGIKLAAKKLIEKKTAPPKEQGGH